VGSQPCPLNGGAAGGTLGLSTDLRHRMLRQQLHVERCAAALRSPPSQQTKLADLMIAGNCSAIACP